MSIAMTAGAASHGAAGHWLTTLRLLLVGFAYFLSGWLALLTPAVGSHISLFWLPAGLALTALLLWGWGMAPAIWLAAAALNAQQSEPLVMAALIACGNLAGPAAAVWLLQRDRFSSDLARRRDVYLFVSYGVACGTLLSAAWGASILYAFERTGGAELTRALLFWWGGDAIGVILAAVPLLSWSAPSHSSSADSRFRSGLGRSLLALAVLGSAVTAFAADNRSGLSPWLFAPHLLLCALALRSNLSTSSSVALLLAVAASAATSAGLGPFASTPIPAGLALLWGYLASLAAMPLLTHALTGELRQDQQRWRNALEASGLGVAEWDLARNEAHCSAIWQRLVGAPLSLTSRPMDWLDHVHPVDRIQLNEAMTPLLSHVGAMDLRAELRLQDEARAEPGWRWCELRLQVQERNRHGVAQRATATLRDIDWQRTAEERQRLSVSLFQHLHEGLLVTDTQHRVLEANPSYCRIMEQPLERLAGLVASPLHELALRQSGHDPAGLQASLDSDGHWQGLVHCRRPDGQSRSLQLTVSPIPEPAAPTRFHVVVVSDLTQQIEQQARMARQARYDTLTGVPNLAEFKTLLDQALLASRSLGFSLCLCCLDLDDFKHINKQHGRAVGDLVLVEVARRLQAALRSSADWSDILARLGGDEFGLLLRCSDGAEALLAVERVLNVLRSPINLAGHDEPLTLTASLGATLFPRDQSDPETLLRHATHALYRIKRSGRNNHEFFDTEKRLRREARSLALGRMQQALDANELQLFFQPKVDMRQGRVLGVEALLRWHHPEHGLLGPAQFLPALEPSGLAIQVGDWVIAQALRQSSLWLAAGLRLTVSVNVSAGHLQSPEFTPRLEEQLSRHAEPVAEHLMLEVLESAALADVDATHALIQRFRSLGVRFALDDFGTGYSTLTYLKRLPVDALKIDRSFVLGMLTDAQDMALVEGVIGLARTFACSVIAEGVETAAHGEALLALGCEIGQGNGIAHAMPAADVAEWVARFERSPLMAAPGKRGASIH